jgi:hypothetical protein
MPNPSWIRDNDPELLDFIVTRKEKEAATLRSFRM